MENGSLKIKMTVNRQPISTFDKMWKLYKIELNKLKKTNQKKKSMLWTDNSLEKYQ